MTFIMLSMQNPGITDIDNLIISTVYICPVNNDILVLPTISAINMTITALVV